MNNHLVYLLLHELVSHLQDWKMYFFRGNFENVWKKNERSVSSQYRYERA